MKHFYILLVFVATSFFYPQEAFAVKDSSITYVIYVRDLGAADYYSLLEADEKTRLFTIVEACIPTGFIAISLPSSYNKREIQEYTQTVILKLISKMATFTEYSIDDMRESCMNYRKENVDE